MAFENMAPVAAMLTTQEINDDSLAEIENALGNDNKKEVVLQKARELGLVDKDAKVEDLLPAVKKNIKENNFLATTKLYKLKKAIPSS